jgi:hypothetical protein
MASTALAGSASSFVMMSLTDGVVENMSRLTCSACEALIHLDLVIVVVNCSRWTIVIWFARGWSSLCMATARCQQASEGAGKNLFPMKTWRCSARFVNKMAAWRIDNLPLSGCGGHSGVLGEGAGLVAPVLSIYLGAAINPCPLAAGVMAGAVLFFAGVGVSGRGRQSSSSRVRLRSLAGVGQALMLPRS